MRFFSGLIIIGVFAVLCVGGYALAQYPEYNTPSVIVPPQTGYNLPVSVAPMVPVVLPQHPTLPNFQQNPGQMPPPNPIIPPHESFREGWRESWTHEFRPLKEYDQYNNQWRPSYNQPIYYQQPVYNNPWCYNPTTGNYQRNVTPICPQPQYYYTQPRNCWNW